MHNKQPRMDMVGFWSKALLFTEFLVPTLNMALSADRATQLVSLKYSIHFHQQCSSQPP